MGKILAVDDEEEMLELVKMALERDGHQVDTEEDVKRAIRSEADYILLDQGAGGTGETFDWSLVPSIKRPWFLAGGLGCDLSLIHI